jgi:hypothetical protein
MPPHFVGGTFIMACSKAKLTGASVVASLCLCWQMLQCEVWVSHCGQDVDVVTPSGFVDGGSVFLRNDGNLRTSPYGVTTQKNINKYYIIEIEPYHFFTVHCSSLYCCKCEVHFKLPVITSSVHHYKCLRTEPTLWGSVLTEQPSTTISWSRNSPSFMESEAVLSCLQQLATGLFRERNESNPHPPTLIL